MQGKPKSVLLGIPLDLEFDFLGTVLAFVFDAVGGADGDVESLAGDLDFKRLAVFQAVGQAAEFLDELVDGVGLFDVAVFHGKQTSLPIRGRQLCRGEEFVTPHRKGFCFRGAASS